VTVNFAVTSGGGSVTPAAVVTGADGVAALTEWRLGATAGGNTVSATVSGLAPLTFTATGILLPTTVVAVTSTSQQTPAGSAVSEPPGVIVRDQNGEPMQGISVAFAVTAGGGSISPATQSTGADGIARLTTWTVGSSAGVNTVTATVTGVTPVTFTATATLVPTSVQATTAVTQEGPTGTAVGQPPGVIVRDHLNNPMQGVTVNFAVTAGGGSIAPASVATNASGVAQLTSWTLGTNPGTNTVTATVTDLTPVTFSATGIQVPTSLSPTTPISQTAGAGEPVSNPPGVVLLDHRSAPIAGASVTFTVTAGGGAVTPGLVVTSASGIAQTTSWTLGPSAGTNTVVASTSGLPSVTFNATGQLVPTSVLTVTPLSQEAPAGQAVSQPPGVIVRDQIGNPIAGVSVAFAVTGGGGSRTPASALTGADGIARVTTWTLGSTPGANSLTATVTGLTPVTFNATGVLVAGSIQALTATSQQAPAGALVPQAPSVRVRDQAGNPLPGATVAFAVVSGSGMVVPANTVTGGDGIASLSSWRLGVAPGANAVSASTGGVTPVTFSATGTQVLTSVQAITSVSQMVPAGTAASQLPAVIVRDHMNNPMSGVTVNFAVSGGGSISPASAQTNAMGVAQLTSWIVGASGTSTVNATVTGLSAVTFTATVLVPGSGSIQPVTPQAQSARIGTAVSTPPGILVRDQNSNPLPGVTVSFAVTGGGGSITPSAPVTGADGIARLTTWTLGPSAGANSVSATVSGLPSVTFNATGLAPTTVQATTAVLQQGAPGAQVAQAPGVIVRDQNGTVMQGITVSFAITAGGGSRTPASVNTGANGIAQLTSWTLGPSPGTNTLTATVTGVTPVTFTATAGVVAASVQAASATSQSAPAGTTVVDPPAVMVRNQANDPVQGVAVSFAVTGGGGAITPVAVATGADGVARLGSWLLGNAGGANTVTATVAGLTPVAFNATGLLPASIQAVSPTTQSAPVNGLAANPPSVIVRDASTNPMQGVRVVFELTTEGGFVAPVIQFTGADGIATATTWQLGADAGSNVIQAYVSNLPAIAFTATGTAPGTMPASIAATSATNQSAPAGSTVGEPPAVIVRNGANEPLQGVAVAFTITAGGGTRTPASVLTGADGIAQLSSWTLGTIGGTNTMTATVTGLSPVTFNATATSPPPLVATTILPGTSTNQQAPAGGNVSDPPGAIIRDQHGNGLSGVTVTFSVTAGGGSIAPTSAITGPTGFAVATSWTLGSAPGLNTVAASVAGLPSVSFGATGVRVATSIHAVTPTTQQGVPSGNVATPPGLLVKDQNGNPMPGVTVNFAVTGGGGALNPGSIATGPDGIARVTTWSLGPTAVTNTASGSVIGLGAVTFTVNTVAPASIQATTAVSQEAAAGSSVGAAPGVIVRDQNGNPLPGTTVVFAATAGGGAVQPGSVVTGPDGTAKLTSWTLGPTPGNNTVTANAAGLPAATFSATGVLVPGTIQATTVLSQQAAAGAQVGTPPAVQVRDQNNNVLAGATVTFAVMAGNGSVTPATVTTNASGIAQLTSWTLGPSAGTNSVTATTGSLPPVAFNATGLWVPTYVSAASVLTQQAPRGTNVFVPPAVSVRDQNNNPLPNVGVAFAITGGGGSPESAANLTGGDGIARATRWTLGPNQGANTMTATVTGFPPITFTAFGMTPTTMVAVSATSQSAPAGGAAPVPPAVIVLDQNGDPLRGVTVTFAVVQGGGTLLPSPPTVITGSDGIADLSSWVLGTAPGTNTVTAQVPGLPTVTFSTQAIAAECPAPSVISLGVTTGGQLGSTGCRLTSGEFVEFYQFTVAQQSTVRLTMNASAFDPYVILLRENGAPVAENDDLAPGVDMNAEAFAILAPGTYVIAATSAIVGESGPFTVRIETTAQTVTDGIPFFTTKGITASQSLSNTDYNDSNKWTDFYVIYLQAGETVTIQMNSTAVNSFLQFLGADGLITDDNSGGGSERPHRVHLTDGPFLPVRRNFGWH
jgi:adhesin/invasin